MGRCGGDARLVGEVDRGLMQTGRGRQSPRSRQCQDKVGWATLEQGLHQGTAKPAGGANDDIQLR
jgi:hypothetical protein